MTSKFLKLKKKKDHNNKDIKNIFQKKKNIDHTWYEHLEIKTKKHILIHYQIKRDKRRKKKVKKNYLLHGRTLLIEGIF